MPLIGQYNRFLLNRKIVQKNLDHIIAVSAPMAEIYKTMLGEKRVTLISNGIDLTVFKPRSINRENFLFFVGRPVFPKGYPLFKEVHAKLQREYPDLEARVIAPDLPAGQDGTVTFVTYNNRQQIAEL